MNFTNLHFLFFEIQIKKILQDNLHNLFNLILNKVFCVAFIHYEIFHKLKWCNYLQDNLGVPLIVCGMDEWFFPPSM